MQEKIVTLDDKLKLSQFVRDVEVYTSVYWSSKFVKSEIVSIFESVESWEEVCKMLSDKGFTLECNGIVLKVGKQCLKLSKVSHMFSLLKLEQRLVKYQSRD